MWAGDKPGVGGIAMLTPAKPNLLARIIKADRLQQTPHRELRVNL
jgi:hypothetical protein